MAGRLGLSEGVKVGVGAIDAHLGAVGAGIQPYSMIKVMGTSTCDMVVVPNLPPNQLIKGICGQVNGSILPEMVGLEAGQSAFGDLFSWFRQVLEFPLLEIMKDYLTDKELKTAVNAILPTLSRKASQILVTENDLIALDWINGRRSPDVDMTKKSAIFGITLAASAPHIFKALVEAAAFGSKAILERFLDQGIQIRQVIAMGGISNKSAYVMQTLADVLNMPIKVVSSEQASALGAAMFASVAAGIHNSISEAQSAMLSGFDTEFTPSAEKNIVYNKLYRRYLSLGQQA